MDDCVVRNYSPLIRQAFGERVIVGLRSSFISRDFWNSGFCTRLSYSPGHEAAQGHPHAGKQVHSVGPPWARLASDYDGCPYVECKDILNQPTVWQTSSPSRPKYLPETSRTLQSLQQRHLKRCSWQWVPIEQQVQVVLISPVCHLGKITMHVLA